MSFSSKPSLDVRLRNIKTTESSYAYAKSSESKFSEVLNTVAFVALIADAVVFIAALLLHKMTLGVITFWSPVLGYIVLALVHLISYRVHLHRVRSERDLRILIEIEDLKAEVRSFQR